MRSNYQALRIKAVILTFLAMAILALTLAPMASAEGSENVKKVQQALLDKGYKPGPVDGVMGAQTRQALGEYQKAQDIPVTRRLDARTANKLGVDQDSVGETFKDAGQSFGKGGKEFGKDIAKGKPIEGGKDLGKEVGKGGKETGEGVKKAVTP
jgi:peptidoglycan hydrolase-like protein with peptidoglycan-binding domain